jgi:ribosomal protein S18 acetylase RimI-like enzyme
MRLTLIEVLGEAAGAGMYSMDWLRARVRWHLDPSECTGRVLVAVAADAIVGHTIVRLEPGDPGPTGLFSTIYVVPEARRRGIADTLVRHGEAWFASHRMTTLGTSTSEDNARLISLFAKHGYAVVVHAREQRMVHLSKTLTPSALRPTDS